MMNLLLHGLDELVHEAMLFASFGFLLGGIDDLAVDVIYCWDRLKVLVRRGRHGDLTVKQLNSGNKDFKIAIFIPAWDEAGVIGDMLRSTLERYGNSGYRLYVGAYPNDAATITEIKQAADTQPQIRPVICDRPGPTTKAHCLNQLWHAMKADEADGTAAFDAILLHDAEDLVDPHELAVHRHFLTTHDVVQIPVEPLIDPSGPMVSGHYLDEFAEAHAKLMPVRQRLSAGLPLAGVGCAIRRDMIERIATFRGSDPFDESSLTEDYELGLVIDALGGSGIFARVRDGKRGDFVATRAYFPATLERAVRQKTRWMIGIALAGWDRTGWSSIHNWKDHWMRMRDRRSLLAVLVLALAYFALIGVALSRLGHAAMGTHPRIVDNDLRWLLQVNAALLGWRLMARALFVWKLHGWREALWSVPRTFIANLIALMSARRAVIRYISMLRGAEIRWDKTAHLFPATSIAQKS